MKKIISIVVILSISYIVYVVGCSSSPPPEAINIISPEITSTMYKQLKRDYFRYSHKANHKGWFKHDIKSEPRTYIEKMYEDSVVTMLEYAAWTKWHAIHKEKNELKYWKRSLTRTIE